MFFFLLFVLFVSYAMASLFGSSTFGAIPWIM